MTYRAGIIFVSAIAVAVLAAVLPSAGDAAPRTVAEIATYRGADRQVLLEEGARKEGTVLVYGTGEQMEPVRNAFRGKYPFVRMEVFSTGAAEVTRRVMEEYKANRHTVDVVSLGTGGLRIMHDAGFLQAYDSPELDVFR